MIHKFKRHTRSYLVLSKDCLEDKEISWRAKGLHSYLISLPEDWNINLADLIERSTDGRVSTENAVNELISKGYITRIQFRVNGRLDRVHYEAFESATQNSSWNPIENTPEECRITACSSAANGKPTSTKDTEETKETEDNNNTSGIPGISPILVFKALPKADSEPPDYVPPQPVFDTDRWSKTLYAIWIKKFGSAPPVWQVMKLKALCKLHGVPTVAKVLEWYINSQPPQYVSIPALMSKWLYFLSSAGGPVKTAEEIKAEEELRYAKPRGLQED